MLSPCAVDAVLLQASRGNPSLWRRVCSSHPPQSRMILWTQPSLCARMWMLQCLSYVLQRRCSEQCQDAQLVGKAACQNRRMKSRVRSASVGGVYRAKQPQAIVTTQAQAYPTTAASPVTTASPKTAATTAGTKWQAALSQPSSAPATPPLRVSTPIAVQDLSLPKAVGTSDGRLRSSRDSGWASYTAAVEAYAPLLLCSELCFLHPCMLICVAAVLWSGYTPLCKTT